MVTNQRSEDWGRRILFSLLGRGHVRLLGGSSTFLCGCKLYVLSCYCRFIHCSCSLQERIFPSKHFISSPVSCGQLEDSALAMYRFLLIFPIWLKPAIVLHLINAAVWKLPTLSSPFGDCPIPFFFFSNKFPQKDFCTSFLISFLKSLKLLPLLLLQNCSNYAPISVWSYFPSAYTAFKNNSSSTGLPVINPYCLSEKVFILPSSLEAVFAG